MEKQELPLGFGFALAMNPNAMQAYTSMSKTQQEVVLQKAQNVSSKEEMQALVDGLTTNT